MAKQLFKEKQHFHCLEVYILISFFIVGFFLMLVRIFQQQENLSEASVLLASLLLLLHCSLIVFLMKLELSTSINEKSIKFKLYPFHKKRKKILIKDIEICSVINTSLAAQWHGSNISYQRTSSYTLNGRNGVYIKTKTDKAYFIGSNNTEQLKEVLEKLLVK